jgi:hypothetical protein
MSMMSILPFTLAQAPTDTAAATAAGTGVGAGAIIVLVITAILGLGTLLISRVPAVRRRTASATLLYILGIGLLATFVIDLGYALNPFGIFDSFLDVDPTGFERLTTICLRLVVAVSLWVMFSFAATGARLVLHLGACAILMWTALDVVVWSGPERLAPDGVAVAEAGLTETEVREALDAATREYLTADEDFADELTAYIAATADRDLTTAQASLLPESERARYIGDLVAAEQQGAGRFRLLDALANRDWAGSPIGPLDGLLRVNSTGDLTGGNWALILLCAAVFAFGTLIFFTQQKVRFLNALALVAGVLGGAAAVGIALLAVNPLALEGILGVPYDMLQIADTGRITFDSLPPAWVSLLVGLIAVALVVTLYVRERRSAPAGTKALLVVLRLVVIALILLALTGPQLDIRRRTAQHSHVAVLLDTSASMTRVDLYDNRWTETAPDPQTGEPREIERVFIRSATAREQFGRALLDRLTLDTLNAGAPAPGGGDFADATSQDAQLQAIVDELARFETGRADREEAIAGLTERLDETYRALAVDYLDVVAEQGRAEPTGIAQIRAALTRDGDLAPVDDLVMDRDVGFAPRPNAATTFYLKLLRMMAQGPITPADLDEAATLVSGRPDRSAEALSERIAARTPAPPVDGEEPDEPAPPTAAPQFGLYDNFVMELQVRRALRLLARANELAPGGAVNLARYRALSDARRTVRDVMAAIDGPDADVDGESTVIQRRRSEARELDDRLTAALDALGPADADARRLFHSVMAHLLASTNDGMRRIDVALELLHPDAQLGDLTFPPGFDVYERLRVEFDQRLRDLAEAESEGGPKFNTLHVRTFAEELNAAPLPVDSRERLGDALDLVQADGVQTAIGASADALMRELLQRHISEDQLAGMVIISDGLNNLGSPEFSQLGDAQVDTVAVGSESSLRLLELFQLKGPRTVMKGNKLSMTVRIRSDRAYQVDGRGISGGRDVDLRLFAVYTPRDPDAAPGEPSSLPQRVSAIRMSPSTDRLEDQTALPEGYEQPQVQITDVNDQSIRLIKVPSTQDVLIEIDPERLEREEWFEWNVPIRLRVQLNDRKWVDEDTFDDNARDIWVTFSNKPTSVLYIEGRFRYEFRWLSSLLQRDKAIRYQGYVTSADRDWPQPRSAYLDPDPALPPPEPLTRIPPAETPEQREAFFDTYDVVIIGDVPRDEFEDSFLQMLDEFVAREAGGVVFIAGEFHNPHAYRDTPLEDIVPMRLPRNSPPPIAFTDAEKGYDLTPAGASHPMLRLLGDKDANNRLWRDGVKGFYWFQAIPREKEGAQVLVRHPGRVEYDQGEARRSRIVRTEDGDTYPLMTYMEYGRGSTLYLGTDDMWYMRGMQNPPDKYYRPFWNQVISHMASRRSERNEFAEVYTMNRNNPQYTYPERIEIEGVVRGENEITALVNSGAIIRQADAPDQLIVLVRNTSRDQGAQTKLILEDDGSGIFRGSYIPEATGNHQLWIIGRTDTVHPFKVLPPQTELAPLPADIALMAELARSRPDIVDGRSHAFLAPQIDQLRVNPLPLEDELFGRQEELSDAPLIFIIVILLLGMEWMIRKRARLL